MKHEHISVSEREDGDVCLVQGGGQFKDYIVVDHDDLRDLIDRLDAIWIHQANQKSQYQGPPHPTFQKP